MPFCQIYFDMILLPGRAWSQCVTALVCCPGLLGGRLGNDAANKFFTHSHAFLDFLLYKIYTMPRWYHGK